MVHQVLDVRISRLERSSQRRQNPDGRLPTTLWTGSLRDELEGIRRRLQV